MKQYTLSALVAVSMALIPVSLRADAGKDCCPAGKETTSVTKPACTEQTSGPACAAGKEYTSVTKAACCEETGGKCCADAKQTKMTKVEYHVDGMTCGGCETKVTTSLKKIEGVGEVAACSESKRVKLQYDAKRVKEKDLMGAIQQVGFKVKAETVELKVDGMTCGGCSGKVSTALTKVQGVQEQKVCHESDQAVVTFDPGKVSREQIIAAINDTGFKVVQ